jgi:hypothetical protein
LVVHIIYSSGVLGRCEWTGVSPRRPIYYLDPQSVLGTADYAIRSSLLILAQVELSNTRIVIGNLVVIGYPSVHMDVFKLRCRRAASHPRADKDMVQLLRVHVIKIRVPLVFGNANHDIEILEARE